MPARLRWSTMVSRARRTRSHTTCLPSMRHPAISPSRPIGDRRSRTTTGPAAPLSGARVPPFPSGMPSTQWPLYLPGTRGEASSQFPVLADYYAASVSLMYKMQSIGDGRLNSRSCAGRMRRPGQPKSYSMIVDTSDTWREFTYDLSGPNAYPRFSRMPARLSLVFYDRPEGTGQTAQGRHRPDRRRLQGPRLQVRACSQHRRLLRGWRPDRSLVVGAVPGHRLDRRRESPDHLPGVARGCGDRHVDGTHVQQRPTDGPHLHRYDRSLWEAVPVRRPSMGHRDG